MKTPILIAISGWKKSGKDTCAAILADRGFQRLAFADVLKDMVAEQYKIPVEWMHQQEKKEQPLLDMPVDPKDAFSMIIADFMVKEFRTQAGEKRDHFDPRNNRGTTFDGQETQQDILYWTPRALCILEGSVKRSVNNSYWVQYALSKAMGMDRVVIPDLRYKSEVTQLKEWGYRNGVSVITVRVNRFETCDSTDPSERDLDDGNFDYIINNVGSLDDLSYSINRVVELTEVRML